MTDSAGFWSYVHKDDDADGGRIVRLAHDIVHQYEMLTNDSIHLWLDRDDMAWGNEWQAKIDSSLASVAFFIPVLTPRYFASAVCRGELNTFARRATDLGVGELLMPILYMDFPGLDDDPPTDELVALVKKFHWVDWRELRFADPNSAEYRIAVSQLAKRLVEANKAAEAVATSDLAIQRAEETDEAAGLIELMARFEAALPELTETTQSIGGCITEIATVVSEVGAEIGSGNQTFAGRLQVMRKLAAQLSDPADNLSHLGDDFAKQLHDVDLGVQAAIERATEEPESREEYCNFFTAIRSMVESAESGLGALQGIVDSIKPLEKLSRDIRPPVRDMTHGLTLMLEGRDVMRPWLLLMDEAGLDCGPAPEARTLLE